MLEETILQEGPDTVAAFIAEPVQGAGGVIVPPDDYFPLIREICTKHDVLFIADEVITGFGRTGDWFALKRWGVEPDILSFAKGITSGYVPLGGIMVSQPILDAMLSVPYADRWMHAYTYSGHPTCCAVGLRNLEIIEKEGLVENAAKMGARLLAGMKTLLDFRAVGDVRGLGLMVGGGAGGGSGHQGRLRSGQADHRQGEGRAGGPRGLHPEHARHHRLRAAPGDHRGPGGQPRGGHPRRHRRGAPRRALDAVPRTCSVRFAGVRS